RAVDRTEQRKRREVGKAHAGIRAPPHIVVGAVVPAAGYGHALYDFALNAQRRFDVVHPLDVGIERWQAGDAEILRQLTGEIEFAPGGQVDAPQFALRYTVAVQVVPRNGGLLEGERIEAVGEAGGAGLLVAPEAELQRGLLIAEQ